MNTIEIIIVEDNEQLRPAMTAGLEETGRIRVLAGYASGEEALAHCLAGPVPQAILMDVALASEMNGIQAAVAIRREFPRMPVVFYSIEDEDRYYRDFRQSGILSHYAYVRKSNYLLPVMVAPLIADAVSGRSFIDPMIEERVQEVRVRDEHAPMAMLEPNEQAVARMLAAGMTNEQIAKVLGFKDKRTISRTNGQIYTAWGLNATTTDEKVARTRAAIIAHSGRLMQWDEDGRAYVLDERGDWQPLPDEGLTAGDG
jgi:DNA-binding NarL/FixJ family response regulator